MKVQLEKILFQGSINFFVRESSQFQPYWHYHPEIEITLITKGKGFRFVGDSIHPYAENDLVIIGENTPHQWVSSTTDETNLQRAYVIQFKKELFQSFRECYPLETLLEESQRGIQFLGSKSTIIPVILSFQNANGIQRVSLLFELLNELLEYKEKLVLSSTKYKYPLNVRDERFVKINNYILNHLDQKLTVEHVAEKCNMVPQSFCRWFRKCSGHSFISFVNIMRVEMACQSLINSNLSIKHIALNSGFENVSHFNRTFKSLKRRTPTEFRKSR
ncbi:AraC family transcriptional regulator [Flagellimonas meridianipacifica]|uniref:AraC-like DNA-binding protein n=1 Tax=Flagellimonas meridianipacifica TaxID=1080225 RepID=A0A2T0MB64_9FLAO|nr:AraC family transcriptional regulator [Allomuricauda pacifica]PRX54727.1 AraC-like DNA-binding protein [Allomuricauda pacifica]